jgi:acetylornithine deacetylase/succinyl-diaminopimelate desuccinylase-like protein
MSTPPTLTIEADEQIQALQELREFLAIPSISTLHTHKDDIQRAAEWVAGYFTRAGLDHVHIIPTEGHPLVYADWLHAPGKPTLLIYGHYDVQPPDPLDAWHSPPFEPAVRHGNLYARGAADDKGQVFVHMKAVERLLRAEGTLPVNVRFLIEGEEEISSAGIMAYVREHPDLLACDAILVSDSPMYADGQPALTIGLKGAVFGEITVRTGKHDLHSGLYGGAAPNAIQALCRIVTGLKDEYGRILIPGFYDTVQPVSATELAQWAALPFDEETYRRDEIGAPALEGELGYSVLERVWARPTLDVNGITGGFQGEGTKTIIPALASCKISMRLVPNQDPDEIAALFRRYVEELCPPGATVEVETKGYGDPVLIDPDTPVLHAAAAALGAAFGTPPVFMRMGGSIPIVALFNTVLDAPCVLMGLGLPDDNLHAPNEKIKLDNIYRGIVASIAFMRRLGRMEPRVEH